MKAELFTSIVLRLRPRLQSLALQFDADREAADDAVQEALMRLWTAWEGLDDVADAERLAVQLTKHACIDAYRQRHKRQTVALTEVTATATSNTVHEAELQRALEQALAMLPPAERRLWTMYSEAQMDSAEIAAATGIAVRSVSSMLSTARRRIVESLKKGGML
jgi:RNA polymerase sigma-70 factor (ECF subfamily)